MSEGFTLWFTGLSRPGKSTISTLVEQELRARGLPASSCSTATWSANLKGLGFSRRTATRTFADRLRLPAPEPERRRGDRRVHLAVPRDPGRGPGRDRAVRRGVRRVSDRDADRARRQGSVQEGARGEIANFARLDPYEPPLHPEIVIRTAEQSPERSVAAIVERLEALGYLRSPHWRRRTARRVREDGDEDAAQRPLSDDRLHADTLWDRQRYPYVPNLDALMGRSTSFTEMITAATTTTPSVALLTGYPAEHGIRSLLGYKLQPEVKTLPEILREHGYHTIAEVTGPLFPLTGLDRGYDLYHRRERHWYLDTAGAARSSRRCRGNRLREPWFMFLHLWELHWPRKAKGQFASPGTASSSTSARSRTWTASFRVSWRRSTRRTRSS